MALPISGIAAISVISAICDAITLACTTDKLMLRVTKTARRKDNNRRADECIMARSLLGIVGCVNT